MNTTQNKEKTPKQRIQLDETVMMCVGTNCPMRGRCWRFRLDRFYDVIAKTPHSNPRWVEPAYSREYKNCPFFRQVQYKE